MPRTSARRVATRRDDLAADSVGDAEIDGKETASYRNAKRVVQRVVASDHDRPSLVSLIACEVGAEIIEGNLAEGEDLNSVELAHRYNTSRTPVREALMLLEKEGMVSIPQRRRPRVATVDFREVEDIYHVRAVLFARVAENLAKRRTPEVLAELAAHLAIMEEAAGRGDLDAYLWANVDFYNCFTDAANGQVAKRLIYSLLLRTLRLRRLSISQPTRLQRSVDDARQLLTAIKNGDGTLAAAVIRSNHLHALAALERYYKQEQSSEF